MLLSNLLKKYMPEIEFEIRNEMSFDNLGLLPSNTGGSKCSFLDRDDMIGEDLKIDDLAMLITTKEIAGMIKPDSYGICICENPRLVYFKLHNCMSLDQEYCRPQYKTIIGKNCNIHPTAIIAENNVTIGDNVTIGEYVSIRENTVIGNNCVLFPSVKLGLEDFEFKKDADGLFHVKHLGGVILEDNVWVSAMSAVNKALYPWDDTVVGAYSKIDMLVTVGHGVKIGANTMIVGTTAIGGRTEIGDNVWVGCGCMIRNGIEVGDNSRVNMGSVVSRSVKEGQAVTGNFAIDHDIFMKKLKEKAKG